MNNQNLVGTIRTAAFSILLLFELSIGSLAASPSQLPQKVDFALAEQYFKQAESICAHDNARLWGIRLCGPMLFADPVTRTVVANQSDAEGHLKRNGNVFVGTLPEEVNIANTAVKWAGVKWTMIRWLLPSNERARARLMFHELFHRVQDDLGLPASNPTNNHLDTLEGRIWLQLEWRALAAALTRTGADANRALEDAIVFRHYRRSLFKDSDVTERGLEMNEGLCEYTGVKLRGTPEQETVAYIVKQLETAEQNPTFVRSFAYASGPPYGFLLDRAGVEWRKGLKPSDDLGVLAQRAYSIKLPGDIKNEAGKRSSQYSGGALRAAETARDAERKKRLAGYRARFIEGPVLVLRFGEKASYSFDPNNVEALEDAGTVYPTLRVTDDWGILEVTGGALMTSDTLGAAVRVPAPADLGNRKVEGDGWRLELKEGWSLIPAQRKGDYAVSRVTR